MSEIDVAIQEAPKPESHIQRAAEELLERQQAATSLYSFVKQAWPSIEGARPLRDGWALGAVCEHMQALVRGEIKDFILNIPPRMTKSTTGAVCLSPWAWIEEPTLQFLYLSYSERLSVRDQRKGRQLIESEWYQRRWGRRYQLAHDQNTKIRYDNTAGGYRVATSVTGTVTGEGADIIVFDDPNSMSELTEANLDAVQHFWEDVMPTRLNDARTGRRMIIQQRGHERDLTGIITKDANHGFVHLVLPMEYEVKRPCHTVKLPSTGGKVWKDPRTKEGELLWPERVGPDELKKIKKGLKTIYNISGQLQQRPSPGAGGIIKRRWFKVWPSERAPKCYYILQSWDTAQSEAKEAAYNACTTWGVFKDEGEVPNIILLAAWRRRVEYPDLRTYAKFMSQHYLDDKPLINPETGERRKQMAANAAMKPHLMLVEDKSSGKSLIQDLRRAGVMATAFNPDKLGDKTQRVRLVTPILEGGRVWVPGRAASDYKEPRPWAERFIDQCIKFPKGDSRDWVDTMTQALWRLESSGWVYHPDDDSPPPENGPTGNEGRQDLY